MNIQTRVQYSNAYENSQHHHKHRHKSENLTDSETDHDSPVKKNKHFFHEAQPFRSDFEAAFHDQQESKVRNSFNIANELQKASQEIAGKIHNEETHASKSQKRTHDEVEKSTISSSGGGIGYKLMVILLLFLKIIGTILLSCLFYTVDSELFASGSWKFEKIPSRL